MINENELKDLIEQLNCKDECWISFDKILEKINLLEEESIKRKNDKLEYEYENKEIVKEYKEKINKFKEQLKYSENDFIKKDVLKIKEEISNNRVDILLNSLLIEWYNVNREEIEKYLFDINYLDDCSEKYKIVTNWNNSLNYVISKLWKEKDIYQNMIKIIRWKMYWENFSEFMLYSEKDRFIVWSEKISIHIPPESKYIVDLMNLLEEEINKIDDWWKKAILAYYLIYDINPFCQWNCRLSRLLMNLILSNSWIWWVLIENQNKNRLFDSLEEVFKHQDITKFEEVIFSIYKEQQKN